MSRTSARYDNTTTIRAELGLRIFRCSDTKKYHSPGNGTRLLGARPNEGVTETMKLAEMFDGVDERSFEERRAEVVAIVRAAADFRGVDAELQSIFLAMCTADDEGEFDRALTNLMASISEATNRYLQTV